MGKIAFIGGCIPSGDDGHIKTINIIERDNPRVNDHFIVNQQQNLEHVYLFQWFEILNQ